MSEERERERERERETDLGYEGGRAQDVSRRSKTDPWDSAARRGIVYRN